MSGFARILSGTQDELTRLAMERKQRCIDRLNDEKRELKEMVEKEMRKITELMEESR